MDVGSAQKAIQSLIEQQAEKDVRIKELEVALEKSEEKVTRLEATAGRCESVGFFPAAFSISDFMVGFFASNSKKLASNVWKE